MKTKFKRIASLALGLVLALALAAPALAAETASGTEDSKSQAIHEVVFKKTMKLHDTTESGITLYAPAITYLYTLSAAAGDELKIDTTVGTAGDLNAAYQTKDNKLLSMVTVKAGDATGAPTVTIGDPGANTATIAFANTDTVAAAEHAYITKDLKINVTAKALADGGIAGVYRYKIVESINSGSKTRAEAGITNSSYSETRYIDVYVGYDTAGTALEINNVVMFKSTTDAVTKTEGWTSTSDLDTYETVDVTVTKTVTGDFGDKTHNFPFAFTVADAETGSLYSYKTTDKELQSGQTFGTAVNEANYNSDVSLSNGDTLVIYGIPVNATKKSTVTVSEKNDTYDVYTYKATGSFTAADTDYMSFDSGTKLSAKKVTSDISAAITDLAFENHVTEISPTGVVLRVAPYAILLGAGVVLLMAASRRREEEEDA